MDEPRARFTGIFIPAEILECQQLSYFEMILLSWIDALYDPEHGGCFASNEYLGIKLQNSQPNTVAKALTKLRRLGLIEDVSFDGRKRVIRALINRHVDREQSKVGLEKNPTRVGEKSNPGSEKNPIRVPPSPYISYSKVENKERGRAKPSTCTPDLIERALHVKTTDVEHQRLVAEHGEELTKAFYEHLSIWKQRTPKKQWKLNDNLTIRKWVIAQELEDRQKTQSCGNEKNNRTLAEKIWNKMKGRKEQDIELGYKYLEFKNGMTVEHVEFGDKEFKKKVLEQLRKRKINIEGL